MKKWPLLKTDPTDIDGPFLEVQKVIYPISKLKYIKYIQL